MLLFLITLFSHQGFSSSIADNYVDQECKATDVILDEVQFNSILMRLSRDEEHVCEAIEIFQSEKLLYREAEIGAHYYLGTEFAPYGNPVVYFEQPDSNFLAFSKWTGGAHCCYSLHIFSFDNVPKQVATIEGGNFAPEIVDLDHNGVSEILVRDDVFAYEFSSFASSAQGKVILKFSEGTFRVAPEYMIASPPDFRSYKNKIQKWYNHFTDDETGELPHPEFVQTITTLVFSGNKDAAMELLQIVWPPTIPGRDEFWKDYEELLQTSRFYPDFESVIIKGY